MLKIPLSIILLSLCIWSSVTYADTGQMNTTLARISTILTQINPLINKAESEQDKTARIQFNFKALRGDIGKIQAGLAAQINRTTIEPRQVKPLTGDYLPNRSGANP